MPLACAACSAHDAQLPARALHAEPFKLVSTCTTARAHTPHSLAQVRIHRRHHHFQELVPLSRLHLAKGCKRAGTFRLRLGARAYSPPMGASACSTSWQVCMPQHHARCLDAPASAGHVHGKRCRCPAPHTCVKRRATTNHQVFAVTALYKGHCTRPCTHLSEAACHLKPRLVGSGLGGLEVGK